MHRALSGVKRHGDLGTDTVKLVIVALLEVKVNLGHGGQ